MSDYLYPTYQHYGTAAERAAFVPAPPATAGIQPIYIWYETDTGNTYLYDTAWHLIATTGSTVSGVTTTGTIITNSFTGFSGPNTIKSVVPGGDLVGSTNSTSVALATTGVVAGTYGTTNEIPVISVDAKGRLTTVATVAVSGSSGKRSIGLALDGAGSPITTGIKADVYIPYTCTITEVTMLADQLCNITVGVWKKAYGSYPATVGDSIVAAATPTITATIKSQDTTLTGWTTAIAAGDTIRFTVNTVTTCTRLHLGLTVTV